MIRVALRGIRSHYVRFLLAVLAVALGVAFVAGTFSLRGLLADTFEGVVTGSADAQAYIRSTEEVAGPGGGDGFGPGGGSKSPVSIDLIDEITDIPGVDRAVPDVGGPLVLVGADGAAVATSGPPVLGISLYPDDPNLTLVTGTMPTNKDEIALESFSMERSGLAVGDRTTIVIGENIREVTVTAEGGFGSSTAGAVLVGLDPETALAEYAPNGRVDTIAIYATDGTSESELRDAVAQGLNSSEEKKNLEVVTGDVLRDEVRSAINEVLGFIQVFLLVFAVVSLFVGGFLITNTFAMSVQERMREFALLRALGASPGQVFASIVVQAFVIGIIGSIVGIAAGVGLAAGLGALLGTIGFDLAGSISLTTSTVVISLTIGIIMSIVAAAIPARRAARTAPVVAMRGDAPSERGLRVRAVVGAVLTMIGIAGVAYAAFAGTEDTAVENAGPVLGVGAIALVLGALILAPALAKSVVTVLAIPVVALIKPLGSLARGNVVRNPRRTASTAGALTIGMVLVAAASVVAASATSSIDSVVQSGLKSDFLMQEFGGIPRTVADEVELLDSVGVAQRAEVGFAFVSGVNDDPQATTDSAQFIVGIAPDFFDTAVTAEVFGGSLSALNNDEAAVNKETAKEAGWQVGDLITVNATKDKRNATEVRIGAIITAKALGGSVYLSEEIYANTIPTASSVLGALFVTAADGVPAAELRADLANVVKPYYTISVADADDLSNELANQINTMLAIVYALLALSIIIAVLGIINTLALSVIERTREISLLRAVGLGRLQLAAMIGIESVLTAVFGTILGVGIGLAIAAALPSVLADSGFDTLVIPWMQLIGMVLLAAVIGLLASLWPAGRAARLPVLEGLAAE